MKRTIKIERAKRRERWEINPATRVEPSGKVYNRRREKVKTREEWEEYLASTRILSIDYGSRRIGLALSDPLRMTAQGLETVVVDSPEEALEKISELISTWEVVRIVVGMPTNMDGSLGEKADEVAEFAEELRSRTGVPVIFWDERLTSAAATRAMHQMGIKMKGRKGDVDRIAAVMILQEYLDSIS